jgi:hypothetical protein
MRTVRSRSSRTLLIRSIIGIALVGASTFLVAAPANAAGYAEPEKCSEVEAGIGFVSSATTRYHPGDLCLTDGTHKLAFQSDGNFVLYTGAKPLWSSKTATTAGYLALQTDGNMVIYSGSGKVLWASNTGGHGYKSYNLYVEGASGRLDGFTGSKTDGPHPLWHVS